MTTDLEKVELLSPFAEQWKKQPFKPAPRMSNIAGKVVALIEDGRANADVVLKKAGAILASQYNCKTVWVSKTQMAREQLIRFPSRDPIPKGYLDSLVKNVDFAIIAIAS